MRGPDMGGGVGGMLYTSRRDGVSPSRALRYNLSNGRGDVVAQATEAATVTWTASYEAFGKRIVETGANADKQRANTKDEDPTGLLNEGFRYRDLDTGVWLSRDPAGFVDGPNMYAYVRQNPWSKFDPLGLADNEVSPSEVDKQVINRIAQISPTAGLIYSHLEKREYKVQVMKEGAVGKMTGTPNSVATVIHSAKTIFTETMGSDINVVDWGHRVAVPHEGLHVVQNDLLHNPDVVSADLKNLVESVSYPEVDRKVAVSPNELQAKRVQNIILQEVGNNTGRTIPVLREYDGVTLPEGTEFGKGWAPPKALPEVKPPISEGSFEKADKKE